MKKIILATSNPHKVEEINAIFKGTGVEFVLPPAGFDPIEDGATFEENALIKAKAAYEISKMPTLADDSGLCVDALDGKPGIYSARYALSQEEKISKMLEEMKEVPEGKRGAHFVCAIAMLDENGNQIFLDRGECFGSIALEAKGNNGFGFDPIFIVDGTGKTMAELPEEEKNILSHRGLALQKVIKFIQTSKKKFSQLYIIMFRKRSRYD